jgi:hypothetical protein
MKQKLLLAGLMSILVLFVGLTPMTQFAHADTAGDNNGDNNNCSVDQNDNDDGVDAGEDDYAI